MKKVFFLLSFLSVITCIILLGCQKSDPDANARANNSGLSNETQGEIWAILKSAEENQGLSGGEWKKLQSFAESLDPKIRSEAITAVGGISGKKTDQPEKVISFYKSFEDDSDDVVRKQAAAMLEIFESSRANK